MKANELIEKLKNAVEEFGDMEIVIRSTDGEISSTQFDVEQGAQGTIDIACYEDENDECVPHQNDILHDLLISHFGHQVEIAIYGDIDCPECVTLEDMDTGSVILDASLYTIKERTDI